MSHRRRTRPETDRPLRRGLASRWRGNRIFYVAVEGEVTEPAYLRYLNQRYGDELDFLVHPLSRRHGMTPRETVAKALEHREDVQDGDRNQLWVMFDCDQHVNIPTAIAEARRAGVRVAFSHPSFELWLLLHFTDFSGQQSGSSTVVLDKLRAIPGFESYAVRGKSLDDQRTQSLERGADVATRRARHLVDECPSGSCSSETGHSAHCDPLRRDPSTDVWQLLVELGIMTVTEDVSGRNKRAQARALAAEVAERHKDLSHRLAQ